MCKAKQLNIQAAICGVAIAAAAASCSGPMQVSRASPYMGQAGVGIPGIVTSATPIGLRTIRGHAYLDIVVSGVDRDCVEDVAHGTFFGILNMPASFAEIRDVEGRLVPVEPLGRPPFGHVDYSPRAWMRSVGDGVQVLVSIPFHANVSIGSTYRIALHGADNACWLNTTRCHARWDAEPRRVVVANEDVKPD